MQGLPQQLVSLGLRYHLLGLQLVLVVRIVAFFDGLGELLNVLDFLLIELVDFEDYLEWPMALAVNLEDLLSTVPRSFLVNFHAIVGSLGALDVEVDLAILLEALDGSSNVDSFLATYDTAHAEL